MLTPQNREEFARWSRIALTVWTLMFLYLIFSNFPVAVIFFIGSFMTSLYRGWSIVAETGFFAHDIADLLNSDGVVERRIDRHTEDWS